MSNSDSSGTRQVKVLIVGGYGVFGGRLARMLISDGHDVIVAGRDKRKSGAFCAQNGGTPLFLDRMGAVAKPKAAINPDIVVDAAGPFQSYNDDPYRVVRAALETGAHYLDFSDDAQFTSRITELDTLAKNAGKTVLSGAAVSGNRLKAGATVARFASLATPDTPH